ncbi:hypothetical protein ABK040_004344 [Willaertia magna]
MFFSKSIITFICLFIFLSTSFVFSQNSTSTNTSASARYINVTGSGKGKAKQTLADLSVGVTAESQNATAAQQEVGRLATQSITVLQQNPHIKNLQTTSISLYPVYNTIPPNSNEKSQIIGYRASTSVTFTVDDITQIGTILDSAVQLGLNNINGITLKADDATTAKARREALQMATQDALEKSQVVLEKIFSNYNANQMEVVEINISGADYNYFYKPYAAPVAYPAGQAQSVSSIPVVSGDDEISATVTLKIKY